jgi:cytochrome c biogenesis protein CcmG/thiol:disulfide interchange protein DsbE
MKNRKNGLLTIALVVALVYIVVGSDSSMSGMPAPTVHFQNLAGQTVNLAQYRGKVVLVNFWATWCEPCRWEIPRLIEYQREYGSKGFTVLGVAMDDGGKTVVAPFVARPQFGVGGQKVAMNYPVVLGNDAAARKFGISAFPTSFVISKDGKIIKEVAGVVDGQGINQLIQKLL